VAQFPTNGSFPGDPNKGALLCWATDGALANQISHNHLSGNATVILAESDDGSGFQAAYTYNSWNFTARNVAAGAPVGTPGRLDLTGVDGAYDACPNYLIGHFSPAGAVVENNAATQFVEENALSVLSCNQDLRQDYTPHYTKLQFQVWNEQEVKFTGAYECSDGYKWTTLAEGADVGAENFTYDVIQSTAAQVKVKGVASTQCNTPTIKTEASGLVGVLLSGMGGSEDFSIVGTTLNGAGAQAGYVLWDAQDGNVPEAR
jgi:hypothetical protein